MLSEHVHGPRTRTAAVRGERSEFSLSRSETAAAGSVPATSLPPSLSLTQPLIKDHFPEGTGGENISVCCCFAVASLANFHSDVTSSGPINVIYSVYAVGFGCAQGSAAGMRGEEEQLRRFL